MTVKTWLCNELEFTSTKTYGNPFEDVDINATFTCGEKSLTFPGFWDGGNTWRVRFALPEAGVWNYSVACTDSENASLTGQGTVECVLYDGELDIYKHGFLKTEPGVRYFMYADGTPFFYLGDTHWTFLNEEFDEPGDHVGTLECSSHFKYIVDKRAEQRFTVYQSEPIDAKYSLSEGFFEKDLEGFRQLDCRFKYIAEKGLVHANAQLWFPKTFVKLKRCNDVPYIKRLIRYWAARYASYPCLWTLAQEVDHDFYSVRGDQTMFTIEDNPYKYMAETLYESDPFKQPLTGHMEYFSMEVPAGGVCTSCSTSAFRKVKGHTWYGIQWSRSADQPMDYWVGRDALDNGQGKVAILYESSYEYLATKGFGARTKGWIAYLNGLYGYGYGAQDMWYYHSRYQMTNDSFDGIDTITVEDKKIHWSDIIQYKTCDQLTYMRNFFEKLEWWKLIPRFDAPSFFRPEKPGFHSIATDERDTMVIGFFNKGYETGLLVSLTNCEHTYQWFNPRTGEYLPERTFFPDTHRMFKIEQKPDELDWILLIKTKQ